MAKTAKKLRLSVSSIREYMLCPAKYSFEHRPPKIPQKVDYPRLCGKEVHSFVELLYDKKKGERKYFFLSINSARRSWFYRWNAALEKNKDKLVLIDKEAAEKFARIGWVCIRNYWETNLTHPDPIFIEKRYTIPWSTGVELTGIIDQVRTITLGSVVKSRPEIVTDGILSKKYNPEFLVDLKTGFNKFEVDKEALEFQGIQKQYSLQRDFQASAYALLYQKHHNGKYPVGFFMYYLKDNKGFFVKGDEDESQRIFKDTMNYVIDNIQRESFPKSPGSQCSNCDYVKECIGNTSFSISISDVVPHSVEIIKKERKEEDFKQLRFKFKYQKE